MKSSTSAAGGGAAFDLDRRHSLQSLERRASSAFDLEVELGVPRLSSASFGLEDLQRTFHSARIDKTRLPAHEPIPMTISDRGLTQSQADRRLHQYGPNRIVERRRSKLSLFVAQFTAPMPIGIWIAIIIELGLRAWIDGAILFVLQMMNGLIAFVEESRAGDAIAALKQSLKPTAVVFRDGESRLIDAGQLVPGDCVVLASGRAIPADCVVASGTVMVDQSAITGESMPVTCRYGDQVSMGSTVSSGSGKAMVIATGMQTFFGKTTAMIQSATNQLGELRLVLIRVVLVLLVLSAVLCVTTLVFLLLEGQPLVDAIGYVVVLAVASIPLAMEVVVTATLALGSRQLSTHKAIVADLSAIERLSGISVLCSDKTGTLTQNRMVVQDECPVYQSGCDRDRILLYAALATEYDQEPRDAIDRMILSEVDLAQCRLFQIDQHTAFDPALKRTESSVRQRNTGEAFRVAKGAPHTVLDLCANKAEVEASVIQTIYDFADRGVRCLGVAKSPNAADPYEFVGMLAFLDPPRPDSASTIAELNDFGIQVKMITGDHLLIAVETCRALRLGRADIMSCDLNELPKVELRAGRVVVPETLGRDYAPLIMQKDGFSSALPEHKFVIVAALKQIGIICGMTGDGVNDAPALKIASVGIAVSGATDAARAAADIVLTRPGLQTIATAVLIARCIFRRMHAFLVYRISATLQLLVFFFIGTLVLRPVLYGGDGYPQFWSMPVLALIFITVLNDFCIISVAYDNVPVPKLPQTWHLGRLWAKAIVLGAVACVSSLLLLWLALDANRPASFLDQLGLPTLSFGHVINMMYLKISLSDFLTLFAARTGPRWFWASRPGWPLLLASVVAVSTSTAVSMCWGFNGESEPIPGSLALFVWLYCLLWFLIQDAIKVTVFRLYQSLTQLPARGKESQAGVLYHYKSYTGRAAA